ncbi:peptigoglycan-binding protein LysM [Bradyrhizobium sp. CCBAU 051011]|uniref:phospholipase effector Tle1 domain-containing protein n=1 Tax=Bradyrhizobium sp. CCBAU 051011 TaxID=858422 RepID=UPI00137433BD|nr:DUF2235 domain-containing protein [Bradyrhizobium sp. CCBAU 051011]QHO73937.1 peptigoglycan-binding protein LysM [Bradyrhizobium sp. CCBAU 051011]
MKRIIFCFDGTWNRLSADTPTNVVLTAASIMRQAPDGITQIIHYDEGVGTDRLEHWSGGIIGSGLVENVREAYRFLIFNYDPGDEIYVFGFSRGAFSAQTFVGFLRHVGPLHRLHAARIDEALELYRQRLTESPGSSDRMRRFRADYANKVCIGTDDDDWRCRHVPAYVQGAAPLFAIKYLGVWDTVSALGLPAITPFSAHLNRKHAFHDAGLTNFVESARHAVAIDERRALFPAVLWGDLTEINKAKSSSADALDAPYQEKWFPGVHGSVGGGGDIRGLSDGSLAWVLKGAKLAGLRLDVEHGSRIHGFAPDPFAPLINMKMPEKGFTDIIRTDRPGPDHLWQLSAAAIRRWTANAERLPERTLYRPKALSKVSERLSAHLITQTAPSSDLLTEHVVQSGDALRKLAKQYYGDAKLWGVIFEANRDVLDDPDELFVHQRLRIPAQSIVEAV